MDLPVECISWEEADFFITHLNSLTSGGYRLPTEAEWEYAARGGIKSSGYKFSGSDQIDEVAWTEQNSSSKTHPVGEIKPNELGLYDMSGNVREWCWDFYNTYTSSEMINPQGPAWGDHRVQRGGSWFDDPRCSLVSFRLMDKPIFRSSCCGFRLAFQVEEKNLFSTINFTEKELKS
jgi:formylglycine-generating enzyme required for sulfatase activity